MLQILTKDSVTVSVDGVVYFRIHCPISSVANVTNAHSSTRLLAQTTLRNVLGTKNLAELLSDREGISLSMQVSSGCSGITRSHRVGEDLLTMKGKLKERLNDFAEPTQFFSQLLKSYTPLVCIVM